MFSSTGNDTQDKQRENLLDRELFRLLLASGFPPGGALVAEATAADQPDLTRSKTPSVLDQLAALYRDSTTQLRQQDNKALVCRHGQKFSVAALENYRWLVVRCATASQASTLEGHLENGWRLEQGWESLDDGSRAAAFQRDDSTVPERTQTARREQELEAYRHCKDVHALPEIYHHWSTRAVDPLFRELGYEDLQDFWVSSLLAASSANPKPSLFVSLGAGNCDHEIALAEQLLGRGLEDFKIQCIEMNTSMVARGQEAAARKGLNRHIEVLALDIVDWRPRGQATACLANHSLHHFVPLEEIFAKVRAHLSEHGRFVINDMIGRNGHMRWPEALAEVEHIWRELPTKYKFNHQFQELHEEFVNWDCSQEGYEGIRAQDILPLLLEDFYCHEFIGFGNVIDVFVDRGYGHNFSPENEQDVQWIDRIAARDEALLNSGHVKPTHMVASFGLRPMPCRFAGCRSPEHSLRLPEGGYRRSGTPSIGRL